MLRLIRINNQVSLVAILKGSVFIMKFFLILILFISSAFAKTYHFVGSNFSLISEEGKEGAVEGLGVDIAKEIFHRLGHKITIKLYPWKRALEMVKTGQADVIIGPYISDERKKVLSFSQYPFYEDQFFFYQLISKPELKWSGDFNSLKGFSIGINRAWNYGEKFNESEKKLNVVTLNTLEQNLKLLLLGRVDLTLSHSRGAKKLLEKLKAQHKVRKIYPPVKKSLGYFAFSLKNNLVQMKKDFDKEFQQMIENGDLLKFEKKYNYEFIKR